MKLLIIVLCLLSERYLQHALSNMRFQWFSAYSHAIEKRLSSIRLLANSWVILIVCVLPILIVIQILLLVFAHLFYGSIAFLLNLFIIYYCLGPHNPFYPSRKTKDEAKNKSEVGDYLAAVNGQMFAVIFWYIALGPIAVLAYRLISLMRESRLANRAARMLTDVLDWLPARMTALLYLLVGNFKDGFVYYSQLLFSAINKNNLLLNHCGLNALGKIELPEALLPEAECLVEHSAILLLALLALFTMVAWL